MHTCRSVWCSSRCLAGAGMKPVCDNPTYCAVDTKALYLGNTYSLTYPRYRTGTYVPSGFDSIAAVWNSLCAYTATANGNRAMCNTPSTSQAWREPKDFNPGFVCGKSIQFSTMLGPLNGVSGREYTFAIGRVDASLANYNTGMAAACKTIHKDMKPICSNPAHCKTDANALYIGQAGDLLALGDAEPFSAILQGKNGVATASYQFQVTTSTPLPVRYAIYAQYVSYREG